MAFIFCNMETFCLIFSERLTRISQYACLGYKQSCFFTRLLRISERETRSSSIWKAFEKTKIRGCTLDTMSFQLFKIKFPKSRNLREANI